MASAAGVASGSSAASSSIGMGRPLAKSAASSSFASRVTTALHRSDGVGLKYAKLAAARELEKGKECGEHLPGCGSGYHYISPARSHPVGEDVANGRDRAIHVEG